MCQLADHGEELVRLVDVGHLGPPVVFDEGQAERVDDRLRGVDPEEVRIPLLVRQRGRHRLVRHLVGGGNRRQHVG